MKVRHYITSFIFIICTLGSFMSCSDDAISTDASYKLSFSKDSYTFNTVFSTIGSTTALLKVYNNNDKALNISSIALAGGSSSPFHINVSGRSSATQSFSDIQIKANDSMYVFVAVTVNPTNQNSPVLIQDSITFLVNGNTQRIKLQAYGQDVVILKNVTLSTDTTLTNSKPYLIYGNLTIGTGKTLTIEKGSTFYFHNNAGLIVNGNLNAIGTLEAPILFRADRLDEIVKDEPYDAYSGQWNGIKFTSETGIHQLDYVEIRNANTGINAWCGNTTQPQLSIKNSKIHNFDSCGVTAKNVKLTIINTQISNCGEYCLKIQGGEYSVIHSTIANYFSGRSTSSVLIKNYDNTSGLVLYPITQGSFINCIIHGSYNDELTLDYKVNNEAVAADFNVNFTSCLINKVSSADSFYTNILWSSSTQLVFVNTTKYPYNFQLLEDSPARNTADMTTANLYPTDKNGVSRIADGQADMGAYEFQP